MSEETSLQLYLKQINHVHVPMLSAEREKELARLLIRENDPAAREEMILANLRLVVFLARLYAHRGLALQDLIAEGNIGLLKAVEAFNPEMNIRFVTYAAWWIKQAMRRALIKAARPIHIPVYMVEIIAKWKKALAVLEGNLGRTPTLEELARHMKLPAKRARIIGRAVRALDWCPLAQGDQAGSAFPEALGDERARSPDRTALDQDEIRTLRRLFQKIDQREAQILRLRFGLEDNQPLTLREIGDKVGLTRECVRQIESKALGKLHAYLS
jgi:RNA polymerase primary sigma factor